MYRSALTPQRRSDGLLLRENLRYEPGGMWNRENSANSPIRVGGDSVVQFVVALAHLRGFDRKIPSDCS